MEESECGRPVHDVGGGVHLLDDDRVQRYRVVVAAERRLLLGSPLVDVALHGLVALIAVPQTHAERALQHQHTARRTIQRRADRAAGRPSPPQPPVVSESLKCLQN